MSGGLTVMGLEENDVIRFLAAATHLGTNNVNFQMEQYIYKRRQDGEISGQIILNVVRGGNSL